ncbi:MAG TPA: Ig-like domain-containing protein [Blastocatellia bacterium]|nr:Ig-like domain-containing protein [Blastocatellia bacterium]
MLRLKIFLLLMALTTALIATGPNVAASQGAASVKTIEITPANAEAEVGQQLKLKAVAKDENGNPVNLPPAVWTAAPSDVASADESGTITFYNSGEALVLAIVGGKVGTTRIRVKPAPVTRVEIKPLASPLVVGGATKLEATARTANGNPRADVTINWASDDPGVATVDAAGLVVGVKPGKATLRASAGQGSGTLTVNVIENPVRVLAIEPKSVSARTGDVVRFEARAQGADGAKMPNPFARWSVSGEGAFIEADGGFVAERPGTYVITATSGDRVAVASVVVTPRHVEREVEIIGRAPFKEVQAAEQWIIGNHAYVTSVSDSLFVYDISDPKNPKLTDTVKVDARHVNDVSTTPDGRVAVITREGAASRKNGIVFLDTSDPAHPKVISEYTATVTGGVHSAFIDGHYVYLTDDATGSLRVINFKDVKNPKEVARWQTENPLARPISAPDGSQSTGGRYLHDVQVKDGLAYLAYWRDGLVILDVGNGIKGGSPEKPQFVSQLRMNYHELYGDGWLAGAHAVFRYKNYVFVGDEVFPAVFNIQSKDRIPVRGIVHVVDVTDIMNPRKVAEYDVPEGGAHNIWVKDDILSMGYYTGGGRIVDVSGELRGDLYRQGREIARIWTGDPNGFRPNIPFNWGAQPHKDMIFFVDMNSGLWIVKLGNPKDKGSTTAPGR